MLSQSAPEYTQPAEGGTVLANRGKILIGLVVLIGALGYLGFMAFQSATVYYYTVDELGQIGPTPEGEVIRVSGKLVPASFYREDGSTLAQFALTNGSETVGASPRRRASRSILQ